MTKEEMKKEIELLEKDFEVLVPIAARLAAFIGSPEFKTTPDFEATLAVSENHQIAALSRTIQMRAACLGGRLQDPNGDRDFVNDETPNPVIERVEGSFSAKPGHAVGNTIIQEG